jgi:ornithine cyclodeaminase/alanine dehydrogenase-like protein (mu-crystallin family)
MGAPMALMLGAEALEGVITTREAIDLLEGMSEHEAAGKTFVSPRLSTAFEGGWMRMMFAADYASGFGATKAFHMIQGAGVRYVVSLYRLSDGELLAILDGRLITDLRTGAASGVVARKVKIDGPVSVGLIGAGHQSRMQLETLAGVYRVESATVFSPTAENRERFARQLSSKLGVKVNAADSARCAARVWSWLRRARKATSRCCAARGSIAVASCAPSAARGRNRSKSTRDVSETRKRSSSIRFAPPRKRAICSRRSRPAR